MFSIAEFEQINAHRNIVDLSESLPNMSTLSIALHMVSLLLLLALNITAWKLSK